MTQVLEPMAMDIWMENRNAQTTEWHPYGNRLLPDVPVGPEGKHLYATGSIGGYQAAAPGIALDWRGMASSTNYGNSERAVGTQQQQQQQTEMAYLDPIKLDKRSGRYAPEGQESRCDVRREYWDTSGDPLASDGDDISTYANIPVFDSEYVNEAMINQLRERFDGNK